MELCILHLAGHVSCMPNLYAKCQVGLLIIPFLGIPPYVILAFRPNLISRVIVAC